MRAAQRQARRTAQLVVAAHLGTPFIMPAAACGGIEPQATLLRFLAAEEPCEMLVDLANEVVREPGRTKRVIRFESGPHRIERHGRADSLTAQPATVAGFGIEHGEMNWAAHCRGDLLGS